MDYEKLHNETLSNLQEMVSKGKITEEVAKGICADFVAESEDEKIRKEIVRFIQMEVEDEIVGNEWLAWLEKQGKQKPIVQSEPIDFERELTNIIFTNTSSDELSTEKVIELGHKIYKEILDAAQKEIRQKPVEWSEEDETGLGDALWAIQQARTIAKDENDMGNLWYAEHWLKSLKDKFQLRPQKQWKPSIAQLNALSIVSKGNAPDDIEAIVSLYNDLKKLRED